MTESAPRKAQCVAVSKKTGKRCTAYAVAGRDLCAGHAGLGKLGMDPRKAAEASARARRARLERRKQAAEGGYREQLRQMFEEHAAEILARKLEIIRNGSDTDALRAIEQTESRIYGKPKETVETRSTEIPEQLAEIRALPFEQKLALLRQLGPIPVPDQPGG